MRKKVGLALGSGGARGYAHIGVIKVLLENKIPIDYVSGASIGALIGSYYALNEEVKGIEEISLNLKKTDLIKLIDLNDPRVSLVKGQNIRGFLKNIFKNKTFEDTKIPLRLVATSLETGKKVVFKSGDIIDAIMSSGAFPGVFPAVEYKGDYLVDGGLADGLPVDIVKEMGADVVVAVDLYGFDPFVMKKNNINQVLDRTYKLLISKLSDYKSKEYDKSVIILKPKIGKGFDTFAFDNAKEKIKTGEDEARKFIKQIKRLVK